MNVYLDLGNSRLKWAVDGAGGWRYGALAWPAVAEADVALGGVFAGLAVPLRVVACSVAGADREAMLDGWVRRRWGREVVYVGAAEQWNGLRNGYQEPRRLGADRWAALVGARQAVEGDACVVDCGTAVTVDALRADGWFLGGAICAGLALTREALAARTAGLRIRVSAARDALARSPEDAIAGGTLHGAAGAVDRLIDEVCGVLGPTPSVLVTGGDADVLVPLLRHPCRHLPDLVLRGVATLAGSAP